MPDCKRSFVARGDVRRRLRVVVLGRGGSEVLGLRRGRRLLTCRRSSGVGFGRRRGGVGRLVGRGGCPRSGRSRHEPEQCNSRFPRRVHLAHLGNQHTWSSEVRQPTTYRVNTAGLRVRLTAALMSNLPECEYRRPTSANSQRAGTSASPVTPIQGYSTLSGRRSLSSTCG